MWREILSDESGRLSSPRVGSLLCTIAGILAIVAGFIMVGLGIKDATTYVGMVLGATMTKGASDLWAAQIKSAKVLSAATPPAPTTTATTPPKPPQAPPLPASVADATTTAKVG